MSAVPDQKNKYPIDTNLFQKYINYPVRLGTLLALGNLLSQIPQFDAMPKPDVYQIITRLEKGCVNATIDNLRTVNNNWYDRKFISIYETYSLGLLRNLDPDSTVGNNETILRMILEETVPLEEIAGRDPEEFQPMLNNTIKQKITEFAEFMDSFKKSGNETKQHCCTRCGTSDAYYEERQIRSGDEGASIFYTCKKCNHRDFDI